VRGNEELTRARQELSFPLILKTASSGYDGKGQVRVRDAGELGDAWQQVGRVAAVAEEVVEFLAECSMIVARADDGDTACFPLVQNQHTNHILDASSAPAAVGPHLTQRAQDIASQIAKSLNHVGILTIEYFLTQQGELIVNEFAPRPHNSGHLTIDATLTSQFEQQVRALAGLPLGSTELVRPAAMANLLGDLWIGGEPRWDLMWRSDPDVRLHLYGKRKARPGRKMGHLTVLDRNPEDALARAIAARARLVDRDDSTR
jgi:5-(carboxyamino)imidazole ribonucleotide synthase